MSRTLQVCRETGEKINVQGGTLPPAKCRQTYVRLQEYFF